MQATSFTAWLNGKIRDALKCHWVEADMLTGVRWASSISVPNTSGIPIQRQDTLKKKKKNIQQAQSEEEMAKAAQAKCI